MQLGRIMGRPVRVASLAGRQATLRVFVAMLAYPPRVELVQRS